MCRDLRVNTETLKICLSRLSRALKTSLCSTSFSQNKNKVGKKQLEAKNTKEELVFGALRKPASLREVFKHESGVMLMLIVMVVVEGC